MAVTAQQGFVDPYNYNSSYSNGLGTVDPTWGYTGIPGALRRAAGYDVDLEKELKLTQMNQDYERASIDSARAWSEYMDNTQIQRRVKDIQDAGLNPWLAVQSGISGTGQPSVDTGGSARHRSQSNQSKSGLAMLLMALVRLLG